MKGRERVLLFLILRNLSHNFRDFRKRLSYDSESTNHSRIYFFIWAKRRFTRRSRANIIARNSLGYGECLSPHKRASDAITSEIRRM